MRTYFPTVSLVRDLVLPFSKCLMMFSFIELSLTRFSPLHFAEEHNPGLPHIYLRQIQWVTFSMVRRLWWSYDFFFIPNGTGVENASKSASVNASWRKNLMPLFKKITIQWNPVVVLREMIYPPSRQTCYYDGQMGLHARIVVNEIQGTRNRTKVTPVTIHWYSRLATLGPFSRWDQ